MDIKVEHFARLDKALKDADNAFWAVISERFPEAISGDYPPDLTQFRDHHNKEDVLWWLRFNSRELLVNY